MPRRSYDRLLSGLVSRQNVRYQALSHSVLTGKMAAFMQIVLSQSKMWSFWSGTPDPLIHNVSTRYVIFHRVTNRKLSYRDNLQRSFVEYSIFSCEVTLFVLPFSVVEAKLKHERTDSSLNTRLCIVDLF